MLLSWASEGFFPNGGTRGFFHNFSRRGGKVVKFVFSQSKLRKQPFFAQIAKIQGIAKAPLCHPPPTPMAPLQILWIVELVHAVQIQGNRNRI